MAKKEEQKLYISRGRIIGIFIGIFFVFEAIFYISFQSQNFWPLEASFYWYTPVLVGMSVLFCILSIKNTYYLVDKNKITHVRMGKTYEYKFKDIIFIDEKWSTKHKMLLFYMNDGVGRYLAFDKGQVIYEYALEYSHLISQEEFVARFPKVKL